MDVRVYLGICLDKKVPQKITDKEIDALVIDFRSGELIKNLVKSYGYTKTTIIKYLKKNINEKEYKSLILNSKLNQNKPKNNLIDKSKQLNDFEDNFVELEPLNFQIEDNSQKDFSSIPLNQINFPKMVYLIVDKNIELKIKLLKEYPSWRFLSEEDLERKTIEVYFDLKAAKVNCAKEQKVIKVPNTDVFRIVSPLLQSRGISRLVSEEQLISL